MMTLIHNRQGKQLAVYGFGHRAKPALIFSNSLGTDHSMWQAQVNALSQDYFVICYDTRGHGKSSIVEATTLDHLAEDVIDILDHFEVEKAHFCGISMGGITGLALALQAPHRCSTVTIANSAAKIGQADAWLSRADVVEQQGLAELVNTTHTRWFSQNFDYIHDRVAQQTIQVLSVTQPKGYAASCRALAHADLRDELSNITVPCLVICGALDPVTTVADGKFMQAHIPQCELVSIEASHLSNIEQPEAFSQALLAFIKKH